MEERTEEARAVALASLTAICADEEARHADRIAAAKLLLESTEGGEKGTIAVVMEGIPKEYLA